MHDNVFDRVHRHMANRLANTPIAWEPYPHIYVNSVFPPEFYASLRAHLPSREHLQCAANVLEGHSIYKDRYVLRLAAADDMEALPESQRAFWLDFGQWILSQHFAHMLIGRFRTQLAMRFPGKRLDLATDFGANALLARDFTDYSLGPHTDHPNKVLTLLFYLPADDSHRNLGTAIYLPLDNGFVSAGDEAHFDYAGFSLYKVASYKPNSMFGFFKTNRAFHGVEPIFELNVQRDLLIYNFSSRNDVGDLSLSQRDSTGAEAPA